MYLRSQLKISSAWIHSQVFLSEIFILPSHLTSLVWYLILGWQPPPPALGRYYSTATRIPVIPFEKLVVSILSFLYRLLFSVFFSFTTLSLDVNLSLLFDRELLSSIDFGNFAIIHLILPLLFSCAICNRHMMDHFSLLSAFLIFAYLFNLYMLYSGQCL